MRMFDSQIKSTAAATEAPVTATFTCANATTTCANATAATK